MGRYYILVIAPYQGLAEIINRIKGSYSDLQIDVLVADLRYSDLIIDKLHQKSKRYDMVISRGGVLRFVREITSIPCLEFEITINDILNMVKLLEVFRGSRKIIIARMDLSGLAQVLGASEDVDLKQYDSFDEVDDVIHEVMSENYDVLVGDYVMWRRARQMGLPAILLTNGEESVRKTLTHALTLFSYLEKERERNVVLDYILEQGAGLWKVTDASGEEIYNSFLGEYRDILTEIEGMIGSGKKQHGRWYGFWDKASYWEYQRKYERIENAGPFEILYARENVEYSSDLSSVMKISKDTYSDSYTSFLLHSREERFQQLSEQVKAYGESDLAVLLTGEKGVGKSGLALEIHKRSRWKNDLFVEIACQELAASAMKRIFDLKTGRLNQLERGTVFFKNIQYLSLEHQKELLKFFSFSRNKKKFRIVASSELGNEELLSQNIALPRFLQFIGELDIKLPGLSAQKENLPFLIGLSLMRLNEKYGWNLVKISEKGMGLLEDYSWPGNMDQLNQVIMNAALSTYTVAVTDELTEESIRNALEESKTVYKNMKMDEINLYGTLDEIEAQVIDRVLKECGMNQSKAAARLGISRSTLYRKMK